MRLNTIGAASLFVCSLLLACSDDEQKVEEPVQPSVEDEGAANDSSEEPPAADAEVGAEEGEAANSFEMPSNGTDAEEAAPPPSPFEPEGPPDLDDESEFDSTAPEMPDTPAANPGAQAPPPQPSGGGIISSGNKWDDCKKIAKFGDRKKCFADAQKANKR